VTEQPYDAAFFDGNRRFADRSARTVVDLVRKALPIRSVVDFGCAEGVWLKAWRDAGVDDVLGLDGDYVERRRLLVPQERFRAVDLAQPIELGRRFDLAQSLEVAEHLPETAARTFVATIARHSSQVLFSAAPPGQGGAHHVNEQPYEYWRDLFAARGFCLLDWIRPRIGADKGLAPWYRFNTFLYAERSTLDHLPGAIAAARLPDDAPVPDVSPPRYKLRKALVRRLPPAAQDFLSRMKRKASGLR
jgi:hypothetical protein